MTDLNSRMIAAHKARDLHALVALYTEAANDCNNVDATCFFLTHAYIFALETGAPEASELHHRLVAQGREA